MRILRFKKLYVPALSIVAVVCLLLIMIGISTYRNLNREKQLALNFLHHQGLALIHSLEAGARTGMKMMMWREMSLGNLMRETAKGKDIAYVYLINRKGIIIHSSDSSKDGLPATWNPGLTNEYQVTSKITRIGSSNVYELAKYFSPMFEPLREHHPSGIFGQKPLEKPHSHGGDKIVLAMKMTTYEEARRADIQHAFIMSAILFVLGSGAFFFIFVIQNYYLVDRTLRETEDYARQVVSSMGNGLISIDTKGMVTSFNPLAANILGLEETGIRNMEFKKIFDFHETGIVETLENCKSILDRKINFRRNSGETVPLAVSTSPIMGDNQECQGAVIILRDLSEIMQLEEKVRRSEKLAAIGELAAGVAHEIRNPLSSIRGFAQFLKHALKDRPKEHEYADTMVSEIDRINRVITDLLTFSRPMKAERVPTDIKNFLEHCIRLIEADTKARNIGMNLVQPKNITTVDLDANQMTQAILNLLLNALQVVADGENIEVGAEYYPESAKICFWVENDGTEIPENQQEKIFEPFFTTRENGTGLGLPIVHKIVENHGGEISLKSPRIGKNSGTRVTITIPAGPL